MNNKEQTLNLRRPAPRLAGFDYFGSYNYHISIHCAENASFSGDWDFSNNLDVLRKTAAYHSFNVLTYCFMPNHLHLLLEGGEHSNLGRFIKVYKQVTAFYYKKKTGMRLWQRSYYDRLLRKDIFALDVIKYILDNPVRWQLVEEFFEYPYLGSFVFSEEDLRYAVYGRYK
jgi:putative transposase